MLKGQSKKDNPEKLATQSTQDEVKHNTICVGAKMVSYGYIRQIVVFETNAIFDEIKFFVFVCV
jgi:hypothetical protein